MRSMQKMWEDYAKEVQVLRERIAELREVLQRDKTMAPLERQGAGADHIQWTGLSQPGDTR